MPIRPSFIATRINGVETYRFSHRAMPYTIERTPLGEHTAGTDDYCIAYGSRQSCVAAIMADASFSLELLPDPIPCPLG